MVWLIAKEGEREPEREEVVMVITWLMPWLMMGCDAEEGGEEGEGDERE